MKKDMAGSLAWGGGLIVLALAASGARAQGLIDGDTVTRIVLGATGLMVAWLGNRMPKAFVPSASARKVARLGGWSMTLSGMIYSGLWAFAPLQIALIGGCGVVLAGLAVTTGYCLSLRAKADLA